MCLLSNDIYDYFNVSQGKITIPNVDDGEECTLTDVSLGRNSLLCVYLREPHFFHTCIFKAKRLLLMKLLETDFHLC